MFRLHIDIPLENMTEDNAIDIAKSIIRDFINTLKDHEYNEINKVNYRLGHDDDRQSSNYLDKNENGHCSNKKIRITLNTEN